MKKCTNLSFLHIVKNSSVKLSCGNYFFKMLYSFRIERHVFVLFLLLFNSIFLFCQKDTLVFQILDRENKKPIPFCLITIKDKNTFFSADENGIAKIISNLNDTLIIHQLGYFNLKTTWAVIVQANKKILLIPKNVALTEISVNSNKNITLQDSNNIVFLDFVFYDDFILTLANKGKKFNSLMLLDLEGNKICETNLTIKTEKLFKDCFNNTYLITDDSIYKVYYNYQKIDFLKPYHISDYNNLLKLCECYHENKYILKVKKNVN
jgi:hypothetical protein